MYLAVADHRLAFRDVYIGCPGRMHDAAIYRSSLIYKKLKKLDGDKHLCGDNAYPNSAWMLTRFRKTDLLTTQQATFNKALSAARQVVERAFGLLKGKFKKLKYMDNEDPETTVKEIAACIFLHNFVLNADADDYADVDDIGDVGDSVYNADMQQDRENMDKRRQFLHLFG